MRGIGARTPWALSLLAGAVLATPGCTSGAGGWDVRGLERRHPELSLHAGHRLGDASPYFAPAGDGLALFLCRWSTAHAVPVALPSDASPEERELLLRALAAWEGAGLGLEFQLGPPISGADSRRGIEIEFVDDPEPGAPAGSGDTVADCAIAATDAASPAALITPELTALVTPELTALITPELTALVTPELTALVTPELTALVAAELEFASVYLRRARLDLLDRAVPLSSTELLGAAVHELGHALGFSGHVAWGSSLMSAHGQLDAARRWGRRLEAGRALDAPTLAALYALPSGVRVGSLRLDDAKLAPLLALARAAQGAELDGPFVRVGEPSARFFWRDRAGASVAAVIANWDRVVREPGLFFVRMNLSARTLLRRSAP